MARYKNFYFCNLDFGKQLTGVERAALKRARLFKNYFGISPVFLTSRFNMELEENVENLKKIGWMPKSCDVLNVYEYLRGAYLNEAIIGRPQSIDQSLYNVQEIEANPIHEKWVSKVDQNFYKYVIWNNIKKEKIIFINSLFNNKIIKREKFDKDGRLFAVQELNADGKVTIEDLIHVTGRLVLQRYFGENNKLMKIVLYSASGMVDQVMSGEEQLVDYWLKKMIDIHEPSYFVIDRNPAWNIALRNFHQQNGHQSASIFHSSHLVEMEDDIMSGRLNSNFKNILDKKYIVDHVITLTEHQKTDIQKRFPNVTNITTIPHSIDEVPEKVAFEKRDPNKIVAMCRLAPEKQVTDMVLMMSELVKTHPKVQLYIYGDGGEKNKITDKIKELKLEESVHLAGYVEDIAKGYNDAIFSLLTSRCEGFSLAVLESLCHGVPAASYDIPYGPSSMIKHNVNGILTEHGNYKLMAQEISNKLNDVKALKKMSEAAYQSISGYKEENVAKIWESIIQ